MVAVGFVLLVFAVVPQTRTLALLVTWALAPIVAYGTLFQVFRGEIGLRSAGGIIFALVCGLLTLVAVPLGFVVVDRSLATGLHVFGVGAAVLAVGFARFSVEREPTSTDRHLPPVEPE